LAGTVRVPVEVARSIKNVVAGSSRLLQLFYLYPEDVSL